MQGRKDAEKKGCKEGIQEGRRTLGRKDAGNKGCKDGIE